MPGGDCNLDIIEAGQRHGIAFVLTRTETAGAIMASIEAELTGAPGVIMTTRGPGLANAVNGVAYASLDRSPLVVIADQYEEKLDFISHQRIDQAALLRPLTKGESRLDSADPKAELDDLLDLAVAQPPGAVYLEINGPRVRSPIPSVTAAQSARPATPSGRDVMVPEEALRLVQAAHRPVVLVGLQARAPSAASALRRLVSRWTCPVLTTYKAKGVVSDHDEHTLGCYIGGVAEAETLQSADLILLCGFDPIEGPPTSWRYKAPLIEVTEHAFTLDTITPTVSMVGPIDAAMDALAAARTGSDWRPAEMAAAKASIRACALVGTGGPIAPQDVVLAALDAAPAESRVTVDSGAHMLSVLHLWPSMQPHDMLVSRGLATMGFALPAAIGSAIAEPERPVLAFTGDGGLMMCTAELGTAVQNKCKLVLVVFNDECLTLIRAKQRRRQLPNAGIDFSPADFATIARGFGCSAFRVERPDELRPAIAAAFAADGPAVIDVVVNPSAYDDQIIALRG